VCECFFMTAAVLHSGVKQLIESMHTAQREYELVLQQGPLARQETVRRLSCSLPFSSLFCRDVLLSSMPQGYTETVNDCVVAPYA
jgi:hypothetical protein